MVLTCHSSPQVGELSLRKRGRSSRRVRSRRAAGPDQGHRCTLPRLSTRRRPEATSPRSSSLTGPPGGWQVLRTAEKPREAPSTDRKPRSKASDCSQAFLERLEARPQRRPNALSANVALESSAATPGDSGYSVDEAPPALCEYQSYRIDCTQRCKSAAQQSSDLQGVST
jgi:hypothetical protein